MEKGLGECKDIEGKVRDMEQGMNNKKDVVAIQTWRWRWWRPLSTLALGQVLSLLITASGVSSSRLAFLGIHAPTTQSLCNYVLLAIVYGTIFLHQKRKIKVQWYYYAILAIVDVEANYLGTNELIKGDTMVLIASFLYAISNVIEEVILRKDGFVEITTWLGIFGSIISSCQLCILEVHEIKSMKWSVFEVLPFIGFAISLFTFYTLVPIFLKLNGSTSLNVSLISSDIWATLVKKFVFRQNIGMLYYVAFSMVGLGLIVHSSFNNQPQGAQQSNEIMIEHQEDLTKCTQLGEHGTLVSAKSNPFV